VNLELRFAEIYRLFHVAAAENIGNDGHQRVTNRDRGVNA